MSDDVPRIGQQDGTGQALAHLRGELAALLEQVDGQLYTAALPPPDRVVDPDAETRAGKRFRTDDFQGAVWEPARHWEVRTISDEADPAAGGVVYVRTPDSWSSGDMEACSAAEARRIGMAFLAAAAQADRDSALPPGVSPLRRPGGLTQ